MIRLPGLWDAACAAGDASWDRRGPILARACGQASLMLFCRMGQPEVRAHISRFWHGLSGALYVYRAVVGA